VAVDLRWEEAPHGTLVAGRVRASGVRPLPVIVLFAHGDDGLWELSDSACRALLRRCRQSPAPASVDEILAACA